VANARYVPALRFSALTRVYDPVVRIATREARFKRMLVDQASPNPGQRILDLGCGTGTLAIMIKRRQAEAEVVGLDGDPEILERARAKAESAALQMRFDHGLSTELPYEDASFDLVSSTLMLHHLSTEAKLQTAAEVARVLRPGGELHVADYGRPADPLMGLLFSVVRVFDGFEQTGANVRGELPAIFAQGGLEAAIETDRLRTMIGTLSLYRARRSCS